MPPNAPSSPVTNTGISPMKDTETTIEMEDTVNVAPATGKAEEAETTIPMEDTAKVAPATGKAKEAVKTEPDEHERQAAAEGMAKAGEKLEEAEVAVVDVGTLERPL